MGIGCILYAVAFVLALCSIFKEKPVLHKLFTVLLFLGFFLQTIGLYMRGVDNHSFPLKNPFEIVQTLAWVAIALNLILRQMFKLRLAQFFASGLGGALGGMALLIPSWDYTPETTSLAGNPWVGFHAGLAIVSYGVFGVLAITSFMYLIQNYGLQNMRSGSIFARLPAIRQLEEINSKLILLGVSILSIAIIIGFLNWVSEPGTIGFVKLSVAVGVWLSYITILYFRKKNKLVASPFAQSCVFLFVLALFSLWPLTSRGGDTAHQVNPKSEENVSE